MARASYAVTSTSALLGLPIPESGDNDCFVQLPLLGASAWIRVALQPYVIGPDMGHDAGTCWSGYPAARNGAERTVRCARAASRCCDPRPSFDSSTGRLWACQVYRWRLFDSQFSPKLPAFFTFPGEAAAVCAKRGASASAHNTSGRNLFTSSGV